MPSSRKKKPCAKPGGGRVRRYPRNTYPGVVPDNLVGQTIVAIRPMTEDEMVWEGWPYYPGAVPTCLVLGNGAVLFPAGDQGSGRSTPAHMIGNDADGRPFVLLSEMEAGTQISAKNVQYEKAVKPEKGARHHSALDRTSVGQEASK